MAPSDAIWRQWSGSLLVQVMAWCQACDGNKACICDCQVQRTIRAYHKQPCNVEFWRIHCYWPERTVEWKVELPVIWDAVTLMRRNCNGSFVKVICVSVADISLTHWDRDKMDAISQTTISNAFSWMTMYEFWLRFHWTLFLGVQLTISQHWFR